MEALLKLRPEDLLDPLAAATLNMHARQWEVFHCPARFRVLVAGRRFGKTELALAEIVRAAQEPNKIIWYVGPKHHQSKRVIWPRLKHLTRPFWSRTPNESDLRIDLISGTRIFVNGAFSPDTLRGDGIDFLVLDEFASMKPAAWHLVFRPALADRQGRALFIGTPQGRNHFYDCFMRGESDAEWKSFQFTTEAGGLVTKGELESVARDVSDDEFRQELNAEFTKFGKHRVYSSFDREVNVKPVDFEPMRTLIWSIDFNVDPMCTLLMHNLEEVVHVIDEIVIRPNATTEQACQAFLDRARPLADLVPHFQRPLSVRIFGDASGNQRHTSGASTDWVIIKEFMRMWKGTFEATYHMPLANPIVRDRINCVNARLRNRSGEARLFIDPKCKELIRDMEEVSWRTDSAGTAIPEMDKSDRRRTHASDALGYVISRLFPLRPGFNDTPNRLVW